MRTHIKMKGAFSGVTGTHESSDEPLLKLQVCSDYIPPVSLCVRSAVQPVLCEMRVTLVSVIHTIFVF